MLSKVIIVMILSTNIPPVNIDTEYSTGLGIKVVYPRYHLQDGLRKIYSFVSLKSIRFILLHEPRTPSLCPHKRNIRVGRKFSRNDPEWDKYGSF